MPMVRHAMKRMVANATLLYMRSAFTCVSVGREEAPKVFW